jgi:uncharacterized protein
MPDDKLRKILRDMGSALVAFSGGVDSALLAHVAAEELGDGMLAVTMRSPMFPAWELAEAEEFAKAHGLRHLVIDADVLDCRAVTDNPPDRCYHCKKRLFTMLKNLASESGLAYVAEGSNASDTSDYRPGMKAVKELGICSPLLEAGIDKTGVRELSRDLGLKTWDKPSCACLASRIPYGEKITAEKVKRIGEAEEFLRGLGIPQSRVRDHGELARIEVAKEYFQLLTGEKREETLSFLRRLGYNYISLDLEGFRSGSMNEVLEKD